jgi:hypothetical protein
MGKWSDILTILPRVPVEAQEGGQPYQNKVDEAKNLIETRDATELGLAWKALRKKEDELEIQAKALRLQLRAYEQLIVEVYEATGVQKLAFKEGGSVAYEPEPHATVVDKEAHYKWCIEQGLGSLMMLPWGTTNSLMKEKLERLQTEHQEKLRELSATRPDFLLTQLPVEKDRSADLRRAFDIENLMPGVTPYFRPKLVLRTK